MSCAVLKQERVIKVDVFPDVVMVQGDDGTLVFADKELATRVQPGYALKIIAEKYS